MPTSALGSNRCSGFTLLELLIVVAIIALASAVSALALRDPQATRLEREAQRLATLLDAARAHSRAAGVPVIWRLTQPGVDDPRLGDFTFDGVPTGSDLPTRWLGEPSEPKVQVEWPAGIRQLTLGPEPLIGAQRLVLRLEEQRATLITDGLGPFTVETP